MDPKAIRFYFDFSSPYGHVAAFAIDALAARHGRTVEWKPFLLGALFKITGARPLLGIPIKQDYARRDLIRTAGFLGVDFHGLPDTFPFSAVAASRAFYWLHDRDPARAVSLAKAIFRTAFVERRDTADAADVVAIARDLDVDCEALAKALRDPAIKARLRGEVDEAVAAGVFGSPFFLVGDEPFWGTDRLPQIEKWLATGGW